MSIRQVCDQCGAGDRPDSAGKHWYRAASAQFLDGERHFCSAKCVEIHFGYLASEKERKAELTAKALRLETA